MRRRQSNARRGATTSIATPSSHTGLSEFQTSCAFCKERKIKCDRRQPCCQCRKFKKSCVFPRSGEKERPVTRADCQALNGQILALEKFIMKLKVVDDSKKNEMLANFKPSSRVTSAEQSEPAENVARSLPDRSRTGMLQRQKDGKALVYVGGTSPFSQIGISGRPESKSESDITTTEISPEMEDETQQTDLIAEPQLHQVLHPQSEICRLLMKTFFHAQYQYLLCLYREFFLRDYHAGKGPYYSDLLLYAICSMGAIASEEPTLRKLSNVFFNRAQELLYGSALEAPNLTTLQALILMGHREIGQGKTSKGWLYAGMAFSLAKEMGLHLDPTNWSSEDSNVEREILRRTYWAAFVADKQLSLFFGRPPALYPQESDVRDTERILYPPEWEYLLNTYIADGTTEDEYEDGPALVAYWIHKIKLCKITHRMMTEVFENRHTSTDETILASSIKELHVALTQWRHDLPANLNWNKHLAGEQPSLVLHLHMMYHTALIILHRPPRHTFLNPPQSPSASASPQPPPQPPQVDSEEITICYTSLDALTKLLRDYSRLYSFRNLPFNFVHILASAASVILMKQHLSSSSSSLAASEPESNTEKAIEQVMKALDRIAEVWPCARQVRGVIVSALFQSPEPGDQEAERRQSFDPMDALPENFIYDPMNSMPSLELEIDNADFDFANYFTVDSDPYLGEPGSLNEEFVFGMEGDGMAGEEVNTELLETGWDLAMQHSMNTYYPYGGD